MNYFLNVSNPKPCTHLEMKSFKQIPFFNVPCGTHEKTQTVLKNTYPCCVCASETTPYTIRNHHPQTLRHNPQQRIYVFIHKPILRIHPHKFSHPGNAVWLFGEHSTFYFVEYITFPVTTTCSFLGNDGHTTTTHYCIHLDQPEYT